MIICNVKEKHFSRTMYLGILDLDVGSNENDPLFTDTYDNRRDEFRLHRLEHIRRQDILSQPGSRSRHDGVHFDVVLLAFKRQRAG